MIALPSQEDIHCGQAIYTPKSLAFYDLIVTTLSNQWVWRCSRQKLLHFFKENISTNHLDIGVGTGYFLRKLHLTPGHYRLGLLDLNESCLAYSNKQLAAFHPEIYKHSVFEPFTSISLKFDSVSLNYVLHCLPGTMSQKAITFDHIKAVLNPGGILFGSTILGTGIEKNFLAKKLLAIYNHKKFFDNLQDNREQLRDEMKKRFSQVEVKIEGCVALFRATL